MKLDAELFWFSSDEFRLKDTLVHAKHIMKKLILTLFFLFCFAVFAVGKTSHEDQDPNEVIEEASMQIRQITKQYYEKSSRWQVALEDIYRNLDTISDFRLKVNLLIEKEKILDQIGKLRINAANDIARVRYLKGLQIIRILYEKVLGLDHHFATVRTFGEISKIANPNQYPEYSSLRELLTSKKNNKNILELSPILGANALASVVQTIASMVTSNMTKEAKQAELVKVECVLDFTLRMQNDLNTIFYETAFLSTSNKRIKQDIESLFREYTKPIGYSESMEKCRADDDWEEITQKTNEYMNKMRLSTGSTQYKLQVNIDFPIDRLLQFIGQYNNFIDQGARFYEKFGIILNSYENEKKCDSKLPIEYKRLKIDVDSAIEKFNIAYKPLEINGSKMKEILYGLNEFDKTN